MAEENKGAVNETAGGIGNTVSEYVSGVVGGYVSGFANLYMEAMLQSVELFKNAIDYENKKFEAAMERTAQVLENSLNVVVDGFSKTANEIGSTALRSMMSEAKTNIESRKKEVLAYKEFEIQKLSSLKTLTSTMGETTQKLTEAGFGVISGGTEALKSGFQALTKGSGVVANIVGGVGSILSDVAGIGAELGKSGAGTVKTTMDKMMEFDIKRLEAEKELYNKAADQLTKIMEQGEKVVEKFLSLTDNVTKTAEASDKAAHIQGVQMGFYGKMGDKYAESMMSVAESVAGKFGKDMEEIMAVQKAYMDASGRAVQMSADDLNNIFAISRSFGMGDTETANMMGSMNVFNQSVENTSDLMTEMYHSVTRMGLSSAKFGKDLVNNLKLAEKYNFKGGVENMAKMTQWAQQTRFNLQNATQLSDKLLNGTISDALEVSAKLQVLGGSAAIYSDPMAMLYEAGADVGSLARRQLAMFSDLMGTLDEKTGETTFSWYENQMIKARAQAAGIDEGEAKNMIRQQQKMRVTGKFLRGGGLSDEEMTAISNRATYNSKTKRWEVTTIDNQKHDIEEFKYNKALLEQLVPEDTNEAILNVAQKSLGFAEEQTVLQKWIAATLTRRSYADISATSREMAKIERQHYANYAEQYTGMVKTTRHAELDATQKRYDNIEQNFPQYQRIMAAYLQNMNDLSLLSSDDLGSVANTLESLNAAGSTIDEKVAYMQQFVLANTEQTATAAGLLSNTMKNFDIYLNKTATEAFPAIIASGNALAGTFVDLSSKIGSFSGELYAEMGPNVFLKHVATLDDYVSNAGKTVKDLGLNVKEQVTDALDEWMYGPTEPAQGGQGGPNSVVPSGSSSPYGGTPAGGTQGGQPEAAVQNAGGGAPRQPMPLSNMNTNMGNISRDVSEILSAMLSSGNRGTTAEINLNNNVTVSNMNGDNLKFALAQAIMNDPALASELARYLQNSGSMAYMMSGNNTNSASV